ncbi:hypothetical protein Anapl_02939 [Anas platyrhynchos]|uniref:Uncharacterized protein n=1 Tax=Anas platyrhynchos TaxID=8839 RepID=R0KZJ6_ANAPL|nr:hypothetical protein Anapl_02939 [Anas platyrhynchos]
MPVPDEQGAVDTEFSAPLMPALPPEVWVALFQEHQEILDPLLPWLRQELAVIFGTVWWQAMLAENFILAALCLLGLDSKALFLHLQPGLADRTAMLVHGIINTVVQRADLEAAGPPPRLHCQGAGGQTRGHPPHRHLLTGDSQLQPATLLLHYSKIPSKRQMTGSQTFLKPVTANTCKPTVRAGNLLEVCAGWEHQAALPHQQMQRAAISYASVALHSPWAPPGQHAAGTPF